MAGPLRMQVASILPSPLREILLFFICLGVLWGGALVEQEQHRGVLGCHCLQRLFSAFQPSTLFFGTKIMQSVRLPQLTSGGTVDQRFLHPSCSCRPPSCRLMALSRLLVGPGNFGAKPKEPTGRRRRVRQPRLIIQS